MSRPLGTAAGRRRTIRPASGRRSDRPRSFHRPRQQPLETDGVRVNAFAEFIHRHHLFRLSRSTPHGAAFFCMAEEHDPAASPRATASFAIRPLLIGCPCAKPAPMRRAAVPRMRGCAPPIPTIPPRLRDRVRRSASGLAARTVTSLASRRALRCCEMAGGDNLNCPAMSPAQSAPPASISTMRWRVGSARAEKWAAVIPLYFVYHLIKSTRKLVLPAPACVAGVRCLSLGNLLGSIHTTLPGP